MVLLVFLFACEGSAQKQASPHRVVTVKDRNFSQKHFFDLKEQTFDKSRVNFNKGWLGIFMSSQGGKGVRVDGVIKGSPAYACGFLKGDIITKVNGYELKNPGDENLVMLKACMEKSGKDTILRLCVLRGEKELVLQPELCAKLLNVTKVNDQQQTNATAYSFVRDNIKEITDVSRINEKESFFAFILQDEEFKEKFLGTMQRMGEETLVRESYHAKSRTNLFRLSLIDQLMSHPLSVRSYGEIICHRLTGRSLPGTLSYSVRLLDLVPYAFPERERAGREKALLQIGDDGAQGDSTDTGYSLQRMGENIISAVLRGGELRKESFKELLQSERSLLCDVSHRLWQHSENVGSEDIEEFLETAAKVDLSLLMNSCLTVVEAITLQQFLDVRAGRRELKPFDAPGSKILIDKSHTSDQGTQRKERIRESGFGGDVQFIQEVKGVGMVVVGGPETTYYYEDAAIIIDVGGDDYYFNNAGSSRSEAPISVCIDLEGNDTYTSRKSYCQGASQFGTGVLIDLDGDDRYMGDEFCQGFGLFGLGVLYDERGEDSYSADVLCQGGGAFGIGLLRDNGGNDTYMSRMFSQGVGFTRGFGSVIDSKGNDIYFVGAKYSDFRSPQRSSQTLGQGFGFGIRPNAMDIGASGGIGVLIDEGGNDTYHGDFFAQGSSYYFSFGMLYDKSGYDTYSAGRYSQGAGIHSSIGILKDGGGDDVYHAYFGMSQGCGYDTGIGYLVDIDGDDFYKSNIISQGAGYEKGFGILSDTGGDDHYSANEGSQGFSYPSRNETFFGIGILSDIGGEADVFMLKSENDTLRYSVNAGILMNKRSGK